MRFKIYYILQKIFKVSAKKRSFKPSARHGTLVLIAGVMWMAIGILLNSMAAVWLLNATRNGLFFLIPGIIGGILVYRFGFIKIANRNIARIESLIELPCVFAFMSWKSYILVAFMMTLGITLRHSSFPKDYLSVIYLTIGLALFLSSLRYLDQFGKVN